MRTTVVEIKCDFCGYGGPLGRPDDFQERGGVDLCRWCATPARPGVLECGPHRIEVTEESWSCSCGDNYRRPFLVSPRVLAALPSIVQATAYIHSESVMAR